MLNLYLETGQFLYFYNTSKMRYLDDSKLQQIKDAIHQLSVDDLKLHCVIELFQCQPDQHEENLISQNINSKQNLPSTQNSSLISQMMPNSQPIQAFPEVAMRERQNRKTYTYLIQSLQKIYEGVNVYRLLQPQAFFELGYSSAIQAIDTTLQANLSDYTQIQRYLLLAISDSCPAEQTRVYTADLQSADYNFLEGDDGVWAQNFLFYNCFRNKILVFILKAVPDKTQNQNWNDDIVNFQDDDQDQSPKELDKMPDGKIFFLE